MLQQSRVFRYQCGKKAFAAQRPIFAPIEVVVTNSVMLVYKILINVIDFGNIGGTEFLGSKPPTGVGTPGSKILLNDTECQMGPICNESVDVVQYSSVQVYVVMYKYVQIMYKYGKMMYKYGKMMYKYLMDIAKDVFRHAFR